MPRVRKIDYDELERLTREGWGEDRLAKHFGVCGSTIHRIRVRRGLNNPSRSGGVEKFDRVEAVALYQQGKGILWLSKHFGVSESTIRRYLHQVEVLDPSRQYEPSGSPRRKRRLKSQEFLATTKRQRFTEENGICQECRRQIGDGINWRLATYHHIVNCKDGGTADPANCMVLHFECHNDPEIFRRLHGMDVSVLNRYGGVA